MRRIFVEAFFGWNFSWERVLVRKSGGGYRRLGYKGKAAQVWEKSRAVAHEPHPSAGNRRALRRLMPCGSKAGPGDDGLPPAAEVSPHAGQEGRRVENHAARRSTVFHRHPENKPENGAGP